MEEKLFWICLAAGLLPYRIVKRRTAPRAWTLSIYALFWSLEIRRSVHRRSAWTLRLPVIHRLRDAAWAAIVRIKEGDASSRET